MADTRATLRHWIAAPALAFVLPMAAEAGEHPGALWSVERLEVKADGGAADALRTQVRSALRTANEVYFYGNRPVRMVAHVTASGAVTLDVMDSGTGAVLVRDARFDAASGAGGFETEALAWMEALDCGDGRCAEVGQTRLASATADPVAQPHVTGVDATAKTANAPAPDQQTWPKKVTGVLTASAPAAETEQLAWVPKPRPTSKSNTDPTPDLAGLRSVALARNPDPTVPPIRISRFDTSGLSPISYSPDDQLVLGGPRTLAPATQALPQPQQAPRTLIGRWVDNVTSFLGFQDTSTPAARPATPKLASRGDGTAVSGFAPEGTPLTPAPRWKANTEEPTTTRLAALDPTPVGGRSRLPAPRSATEAAGAPATETPNAPASAALTPAALALATASTGAAAQAVPTTTATGLRIVRSPGLGVPRAAASPLASPLVTPIRVASASGTGSSSQNLSIRLHPEIFGRYSTQAANKLLTGRQGTDAPVRLVTSGSSENPGSGTSVDRVLAKRGLALDSDKFAKAERIFWSGRTGSRGFWISLPQAAPSNFVLVASSKASVIANVFPRGSAVQVSDSVAEALGLKPGEWSDVQIVALKQADRTASRTVTTRTQ